MADEATKFRALRDIVRDASALSEKRRELDSLRLDHVREWAQNREFYNGNQWVFWNGVSNRIETYGTDDGDKPRWKVRITSNQCRIGVTQLVAQMTKTRPVIRAMPDSGADRDVKSAEMAERLYENWWHELGMGPKLKSALVNAQISQGYWLITWDPLAGKSMKIMLNPETGEPIGDEDLADILREEIRDQAKAFGVPEEQLRQLVEKTLSLGDIDVKVLDGPQVWLDPIPSNFEDCKYAICRYGMDVDEIEARWGKRVEPNASTAEPHVPLMYTRQDDNQRPKNAREVYFGYFRPSPMIPKGRIVIWIEEPDEILFESDWDLPFSRLPLIKFPGMERPGSALDNPRMTDVRPLQKELNSTISKVAMHKNLTMKPQMVAPVNSLRQRLTDEPGAVFEYAPMQGHAPEWRPIPNLPAYVFEYLRDIQGRIDRLFNLMPTERNQLPARTDSGQLVDLVQEAVADQLAPEIQRMEQSLAEAGDIMAAYAQTFYLEERLLKIRGPGGSVQVEKFLNADISGGFSFDAMAGSGLPRTRAGRLQEIMQMIEMRLISPQEAAPYLPIAGLKTIQSRLQADEEFASRKVEKLLKGEPINVPAIMDAIQVVQTGMNPKTGEMFQSPEEAQAFVQEASLQPLPFENLQVSAYILGQRMKSREFENYDPEVQQRFLTHYGLITQAITAQPVVTDPPKVNLSLKGTVGPTVAADMLRQKGIRSATPETMAEPPLETSVYDSVDKPDADAAGNDPLDMEERLASMQQADETHQLKQAKTMREMEHAEAEHAWTQGQHLVQHGREEEMHQERLRQMRQPKPAANKRSESGR